MPCGGRKKMRRFCLPSCFSVPSVWEREETDFPPEISPLSYLTRLRSLSRMVEIAGDGGEGHVEVSPETQSDVSPDLLSPPGNRVMALMHKFRKAKKTKKSNTKFQPHAPTSPYTWAHNTTVQPRAPTSPYTWAHHKVEYNPSVLCHVSTKLNSPLHERLHTRDPVHNIFRTSHPPLTPRPNRPTGPAPSPARPTRRLDPLTGVLLLLTATLTVTLLFGRLRAVLCSCVWFYLLSCVKPPPPSPLSPAAAPPPATERDDIDSPAYKKKVVLMGLLERNRCDVSGRLIMTPLGSPATARLR